MTLGFGVRPELFAQGWGLGTQGGDMDTPPQIMSNSLGVGLGGGLEGWSGCGGNGHSWNY